MFGFLKQKKVTASPAPSQPLPKMSYADVQLTTPSGIPSPLQSKEVNVVFMAECFARALHGLQANRKFQSCYVEEPKFNCMMMPEGIEVAGSAEMQTSAILAENVMTLATVDATPLHWSHVVIDSYVKHRLGVDLNWDVKDDGSVVATLAINPAIELEFAAASCDTIDPVWSGEKLPGASLMIQVKSNPPLGGTH